MPALGLLVLRLALSAVLTAHGAHQLFGAFAGPGIGTGGLATTTVYFQSLGISPAFAAAAASGVVQLVGGLLIAIGWLTRVAAFLVAFNAAVIVWADQIRWGFFVNWVLDSTRGHGVEHSLLLLGAALCLSIGGAGEWSIDGLRQRSAASRAAGRARIQRG